MQRLHRSLAQSRRDDLVRKIRGRGKKASNIWYVFAAGSRSNVVLLGDLRFELFLATEGDPDVDDAEYNPKPITVALGDTRYEVGFDAIVRRCDGQRECRDVHETSIFGGETGDSLEFSLKKVASQAIGAAYREFTLPDLDRLQQRTRNWARAIAALARCRHVELAPEEHAVALSLADGAMHSLGALIQAFDQMQPAHVIAAAVSLLRKRAIRSDLDTHRWGLRTQLWQEANQR